LSQVMWFSLKNILSLRRDIQQSLNPFESGHVVFTGKSAGYKRNTESLNPFESGHVVFTRRMIPV